MLRRTAVWVLCAGCSISVAFGGAKFVDVATERNLVFTGDYGPSFPLIWPQNVMQLNMGNGAAVGDIDGDGDLDVYLLAQLDLPNKLFRNDLELGTPTFTDITATAGIGDLGHSRVAQFVDLDNDADLDLVLVNDTKPNFGYPDSKLFRNDGNGVFTDVTPGSGFAPEGYLRCGLAVADYDGDGMLDLYVTNWKLEAGTSNPQFPGENVLYRNLGGFVFADVTVAEGLDGLARDSFTAIFHDFDGDHRPDLWVAVDHTSDEFYRNTPTGFVNETSLVGAGHTGNDMGASCADFDDDDDLDLYLTNITDSSGAFGYTQFNALHRNELSDTGSLAFVDEAVARGAGDTYWGWGVEFTDVENDGDLDLIAATGFDEYIAIADPLSPILDTPAVFFENDGLGQFSRNSTSGLEAPDDSRALIAFDYDRDGDEDLLVTNTAEPARLYENRSSGTGHWLGVRLIQSAGNNRNGIGASILAATGDRTRRRELIASDSYLSGSPAEVVFGLGAASAIDELLVRWTDGSETSFPNVAADRWIEIEQGGADTDGDGTPDSFDCNPGTSAVWSAPSAIDSLRIDGGAAATLSWNLPTAPGTASVVYDVLKFESSPTTAPTCESADQSSIQFTAPSVPASIEYYLVVPQNVCGRNAGIGFDGLRVMADCI